MVGKTTYDTADAILELLALKHSRDIFVPECKDGPTHTATHRRMDAWVMPRSWSKSACICYEIKTTRDDFLYDKKWRDYLPLCQRFYFVTPKTLIKLDEIPAEAGWIWYNPQRGGSLYTKKAAPFRDLRIPENVFRYVLMCRTEMKGRPSETAKWISGLIRQRDEARAELETLKVRLGG